MSLPLKPPGPQDDRSATPETDAAQWDAGIDDMVVSVEFARRLERERNETARVADLAQVLNAQLLEALEIARYFLEVEKFAPRATAATRIGNLLAAVRGKLSANSPGGEL